MEWMMKNNLFIIAKSGWNYVVTAFSLFILFMILDCDLLAFVALLLTAAFIYAFRNPERELLSFEDESILSPVDGVVTAITELEDSEYAYRVDIESGYLDVSLLRVPIQATVEVIEYRRGSRLSKKSNLAEKLNENVEIIFMNKKGSKVKVKHTLTQSFAPLAIDISESQTVLKSARYGVMLSGITSIYLPADVRLNINIANELKASETLVGFFS